VESAGAPHRQTVIDDIEETTRASLAESARYQRIDVLVSEIAMEVLDVLGDLEGLLLEYGNDVDQVLADEDALATWSDAEPETRSAILLNLAWQTRESYRLAEDGGAIATSYAESLHGYAATFTGDDAAFHGNPFPAMPLPAQAAVLSMSIGFDRDKLACR
jgi:hypothetical protein